MTKHPFDPGSDVAAEKTAKRYAEIERKQAPEGSHPAVKSVIRRKRQTGTTGDLARAKKLSGT